MAAASQVINGQVYFYPPNTLRISPGNGALFEPSSTNLILESQGNFSNTTYWSSLLGTVTVTDNTVASPALSVDGSTLAFPSSAGVDLVGFGQTTTLPATASYSDSVWLKGAVGGELVTLQAYDSGTLTVLSTLNVTLTTSWVRYSLVNWSGTLGHTVQLRILNNQTAAFSIYIYGAQREQLVYVTSYIPTTTATVTRGSEYVQFEDGTLTTAQGSMSVDAQMLVLPTNAMTIGLFRTSGAGAYLIQLFWNSASTLSNFMGAQASLTPDFGWHHYAVSWRLVGTTITTSIYYDRVFVGTASNTDTFTVNTPLLGASNNGSGLPNNSFWGYMKNWKMSTDPVTGL